MDANNYKNEIRLLISQILSDGIKSTEVQNKIISYLYNIEIPEVEYLYYALLYSNQSTPMIDLVSNSFVINKLLLFLNDNQKNNNICKNSCQNNRTYEPMTEEKALTLKFDRNDEVVFPDKGFYGKMFEKFQIRENDGKLKEVSREYKIDHEGRVVAFYGETITDFDESIGYYAGSLGDHLFNKELTENDL